MHFAGEAVERFAVAVAAATARAAHQQRQLRHAAALVVEGVVEIDLAIRASLHGVGEVSGEVLRLQSGVNGAEPEIFDTQRVFGLVEVEARIRGRRVLLGEIRPAFHAPLRRHHDVGAGAAAAIRLEVQGGAGNTAVLLRDHASGVPVFDIAVDDIGQLPVHSAEPLELVVVELRDVLVEEAVDSARGVKPLLAEAVFGVCAGLGIEDLVGAADAAERFFGGGLRDAEYVGVVLGLDGQMCIQFQRRSGRRAEQARDQRSAEPARPYAVR